MDKEAVLISIQPKWCELIANGEKTIEVRKTKPRLKPPFKCYIYCTKSTQSDRLWVLSKNERKGNSGLSVICANLNATSEIYLGDGKAIGEFVCDIIEPIAYTIDGYADILDCKFSCMLPSDFLKYGKGGALYGWHISDLKIYDEPKKLGEFGLTRPPQSWCYIMERRTDNG